MDKHNSLIMEEIMKNDEKTEKICSNCKNTPICDLYKECRFFPAMEMKDKLPKSLLKSDTLRHTGFCDVLMKAFSEIYFKEVFNRLPGICCCYTKLETKKEG